MSAVCVGEVMYFHQLTLTAVAAGKAVAHSHHPLYLLPVGRLQVLFVLLLPCLFLSPAHLVNLKFILSNPATAPTDNVIS